MLGKSSKLELGFVHYIKKFTISRFVISRFECISDLFIFFVYNNCLHYLFTFSESRNNPSRGSDHPESPSSQQQTKMNTLECFETPVYTFTLPDITRYPGKYIFINNN